MNHGSPRPILALLALALAVPGASAQSLHYTDPAGDVRVQFTAPLFGPAADVVDLLETTFTVANGTLAITFHLVDLSNVDALSVEQIDYYAIFTVYNETSEAKVGVEALRFYLSTSINGATEFPAPWEFRFQPNPLEHAGPSINGTVDVGAGTVSLSFPLNLVGLQNPTKLVPYISTGSFSTSATFWQDDSLAPGSALNLTEPATEPEPQPASSTTTREAIGVPLLACLAALALAARSRR